MPVRRVVASFALLGLALAGLGYGTFAFFSDEATSAENVFSVAALDLHLDGVESVTGILVAEGMVPGERTPFACITLSSVGASSGFDLDVALETSGTDAPADPHDAQLGGPSAAAFDTFLALDAFSYGGASLIASVGDADGDGRVGTLADAAAASAEGALADLAVPGEGRDLCLRLRFDVAAPPDLAGDRIDLTLRFLLAQSEAPDLGPSSTVGAP